ncbi:MAG: CvpA family protein [Francisellaceae bacterium]|jgi:membrane protein required for colicin V production|nr:CvpA family protein [Francisellaceae bacterium]MBT6208034.1 CvpA family protein [Francisellaceae bacterium]MBT6538942.1 CvpA family protein [Francisellaceae bacterium]
MSWVDLAVIGVVLVSTLIGIYRGFVKEILTLISWATAITLAYNFYHLIDPYIEFITIPLIRSLVAGFIILLAVLVVLSVVNFIISKSLSAIGFKWFDRSLGAGFGFARALLVMSIAIILISPQSDISISKDNASLVNKNNNWKKDSILYPRVEDVAFSLHKQLPKNWVQKITNYLL